MMNREKNKTFKGMLKILIHDYQKQNEGKMYPVVQELIKAQHELREVKRKLEALQAREILTSPDDNSTAASKISLFVQYDGFFNQLCDIEQTMTIENLFVKLRQLTGIPTERAIRVRVLGEDDLRTLFFIENEPNRTLGSYHNDLKARMILNIEDNDDDDFDRGTYFEWSKSTTSSERTYSFDESDV